MYSQRVVDAQGSKHMADQSIQALLGLSTTKSTLLPRFIAEVWCWFALHIFSSSTIFCQTLHDSGILNRILELQRKSTQSPANMASLASKIPHSPCTPCGDATCTNWLDDLLLQHWVNHTHPSDDVRAVAEFMAAKSARDCSVLISVTPQRSEFNTKVVVVDLDRKSYV